MTYKIKSDINLNLNFKFLNMALERASKLVDRLARVAPAALIAITLLRPQIVEAAEGKDDTTVEDTEKTNDLERQVAEDWNRGEILRQTELGIFARLQASKDYEKSKNDSVELKRLLETNRRAYRKLRKIMLVQPAYRTSCMTYHQYALCITNQWKYAEEAPIPVDHPRSRVIY